MLLNFWHSESVMIVAELVVVMWRILESYLYAYTNPYTRSSTTYPNTQFYHNYIQHWIKIKLPWSCWRKFCLDKIYFTRQFAHINCINIHNKKEKSYLLILLFTCDQFHHLCPHNSRSSADWVSTWWSDPLRTDEETGTPPMALCPLSKMKIVNSEFKSIVIHVFAFIKYPLFQLKN